MAWPAYLFLAEEHHLTFLYLFDHAIAGGNADEWYFAMQQGRLVSSGYNHCGINDLGAWRPAGELP